MKQIDKIDKATEFLSKASLMLDWSERDFHQMVEFGKLANIDEIKRLFFNVLTYISSASQALDSASSLMKLKEWQANFSQQNENDPLLKYLVAARNVDVHDRLIKWEPKLTEITLKIVDAEKFNKAGRRYPLVYQPYMKGWCYVMNAPTENQAMRKFSKGTIPSSDRMLEAGTELQGTMHALQLIPFTTNMGKNRNFTPPTVHLDNPLPPTIENVLTAAIKYYRTKKMN